MTPTQAKSIALNGMAHKRLVAATSSLDDLLAVQCSNGNWNYDPYFHGMANGMILSKSVITGEIPVFLSAPECWLRDISIGTAVTGVDGGVRRKKSKIDIGRRFGRLVVLREVEGTRHGEKQKLHRNVECQCDCGVVKTYNWTNLTNVKQGTKSCGCFQRQAAKEHGESRRKSFGEAAINAVIGRYKHQAKKRGLEFELTRDQAVLLFGHKCHYCGLPPSNTYSKNVFGALVYSGIDRQDNSKGYTVDNCVSCCSPCNDAKGTMSVSEFCEFVRRLASNFPFPA